MKTEIELKPCPFCGGKAAISRTKESGTKAYCKDCYCKTVRYIGVLEKPEAEKEMATQVWNKRASGWGSVKDRLPKDGESILIFVNYADHERIQYDTCYYDSDGAWLDSGYNFGSDVTHWMPLPEPPEMKGE